MARNKFFALGSFLIAATALGAAEARGAEPAAATFQSSCALCHGADGSGQTPAGQSMQIPALDSAPVQSQTDAELADVIANGKNNMPPFKGSLNSDQIRELVAYLRQLKPKM